MPVLSAEASYRLEEHEFTTEEVCLACTKPQQRRAHTCAKRTKFAKK